VDCHKIFIIFWIQIIKSRTNGEKLDTIQDDFVHYQLLRFCHDVWDVSSKVWSHMVLHLPHAVGGYGVTFNEVTKDDSFYTTTSVFVV
jgi:hypothetical protein